MTSATTGPDAPRDSTLRYGVVGTGMMGVEHIENILALDGAAVTAVADPHGASQEAARRAVVGAGSPNEPLVVDTVEELLAADACDAVVVASPNHTHCDTLLAVLAVFSLLETLLDPLLDFLPGYLLSKCIFLVWCMAPSSKSGSNLVFTQVCTD